MTDRFGSQRVIVVLGMHRGGTSLAVRGLLALGVTLGSRLLQAQADNPTGFWEDEALVALNDRVLGAIGLTWYSAGITDKVVWETAAVSRLVDEAVGVIDAEFRDAALWAFKDPRTARLLPFWRRVFDKAGSNVSYLVVARNPISVARSLADRNGFRPEKSHLLWLQHLLPALIETRGRPRVVVDYDRLLDAPMDEMQRVAASLALPISKARKGELHGFASDFVDRKLRHSAFEEQAVQDDPDIVDATRRLYALVARVARDDVGLEDAWVQQELAKINAESIAWAPIYRDLDLREEEIERDVAQLHHEAQRFQGLEAELTAEREARQAQASDLERLNTELHEVSAEHQQLSREYQHVSAAHQQLSQEYQHVSAAHQQLRDSYEEVVRALDCMQNTLTWRLARYPRAIWGTVRRPLMRVRRPARFRFTLRETPNLERLDRGTNAWEIRGDGAALKLEPAEGGYPVGLVRIRHSIVNADGDPVDALLHVATDGAKTISAVSLPESAKGEESVFVTFPENLISLRITPLVGQGLFQLKRLDITAISPTRLLATRLWNALWAGRGARALIAKGLYVVRSEGWRSLLRQLEEKYGPGPGRLQYAEWMARYDSIDDSDREAIRHHIARMQYTPLISVIMPAYNTPEVWLREAIRSVIDQCYSHWELCIANDASTVPRVDKTLREFAEHDARIKLVRRAVNGHIAAATNSALALATGEFVAFLDHDDKLSPLSLYRVAVELNQRRDADVIYSDEDKITEHGVRFDPHFKSDWNRDLFFAQNYVSHLSVYRANLVRAVGGLREGYDGSQDYDLMLRCLPKTRDQRIRHIPHILYHWRAVSGSTALTQEEKSYPWDAGVRALADYFAWEAPEAKIEKGPWPTTYRVRYPIPDSPPMVSLIIPTRNGYDLLFQCVSSIRGHTSYPNYEIIIVDNGSVDERTLEYLEELGREPGTRVLPYDRPFNFSAINNFAVAEAAGELVGLINNDIEAISSEWLSEMVSLAIRPDVGAVGAKLLYGDGRIQHGGVILGIGGVAGHSHKGFPGDEPGYFSRLSLPQTLSAVTAACLLIRRGVYEEVGGLDEENLSVAFNDVDFCLKVREAGFRNIWTPYSVLYHHESASRGLEDTIEKQQRFSREVAFMLDKWGPTLKKDPYYNANLTLEHEDFSVSTQPLAEAPWRRSSA